MWNKFDYVSMSFVFQVFKVNTAAPRHKFPPAEGESTAAHVSKTKHINSISFIDTLLLQFTMHSTDLVQYSLNHNGISPFYSFLHNNVWYLQTRFLEALGSVHRFRVCDESNYSKSVQWSLCQSSMCMALFHVGKGW